MTERSAARPETSRSELERRDLLKALTLVGGAAATGLAPSVAQAAAESPQEQVKARYAETEHVKRFYELNRL
jgi:nitrous oxide reductase